MIWIPFLCLAVGLIIGFQNLQSNILKIIDSITNIALVILMMTIGANIGANDSIMSNLTIIGFNCIIISLSAIFFSILLTFLLEKTILPLEGISLKLTLEKIDVNDEVNISKKEENKTSPLIWAMPLSIIIGVLFGRFLISQDDIYILSYALTASLMLLYICVGTSIGSNRSVFKYIKLLGWKIVLISVAIFIGSMTGGYLSGLILHLPLHISIMSAGGMSYYSLTGAYMTQVYGIETGMYGFMVNVMREFITVLFLPLLIKISKGSPIAGGAAGNMDTMLVPITKFVGLELGLVTLITGTILTFVVPFILPVLNNILT